MKEANICIFGDSIAWGAFDHTGGGWAERLKSRYMSQMGERWIEIFNLGICGKTSENLVERFEAEAVSRGCDIALVAIGINDSAFRNGDESANTVSETDFQTNLEIISRSANRLGIEIAFVWLTRVEESCTTYSEKSYKNRVIDRYDNIIRDFCVRNGLSCINLSAQLDWRTDLDPDGLHPNDRGHEKIANLIHDFLGRKICQ